MSNKFDAAIEVLDQAQGEMWQLGEVEGRGQCLAAIALLEAAGKVDKEGARLLIRDLKLMDYINLEDWEALVESLPDKPGN